MKVTLGLFGAALVAATASLLTGSTIAAERKTVERAVLRLIRPRGFTAEDIEMPEFEAMPEPFPAKEGATYHLDAKLGSDDGGDGTEGKPFKTITHVWPQLRGGDTVLLHDGEYGELKYSPYGDGPFAGAGDLFDDWVTIEAAPGASPRIQRVSIYQRSGEGEPKPNGYLKFKGVRFLDGINLRGAAHFAVLDSRIECPGPLNGPVENLLKTGLQLDGVAHALIKNNEITHVGTGIAVGGEHISIVGNHIHDGSHDGMQVVGLQHSLIADNRIHGFDDGYWDEEAAKLKEQGKDIGNRHCDGIHIFIRGGSCDKLRPNAYVMFRGNVLYDFESQGLQFNNYFRCPDVRNNHLYFENNVFGPTHANTFNAADPVDVLVFRHNTFVPVEGRVYESRYRSIPQDNSTFRVSDNYTNVAIYNNILSNGVAMDDGHVVNDWNLIWNDKNLPALARHSMVATDIEFKDPEKFDGRLPQDSPAVDAGTRQFATAPLSPDRYGTPRDARPDMGAYEVPGRSPEPEKPLPPVPEKPTVFVDGFEDGNLGRDPFLNGEDRQGLSWTRTGEGDGRFRVGRGPALDSPPEAGTYRVFSEQGENWRSYTFAFDAHNAYQTQGAGPLFLVRGEHTYYFLDIARESGKLIRTIGGKESLPAENPSLRLPHGGGKAYVITIRAASDAIEIAVDVGRDGSAELEYRDTGSEALETFRSGGIGFLRDYRRKWSRVKYDNVRVEVSEYADGS